MRRVRLIVITLGPRRGLPIAGCPWHGPCSLVFRDGRDPEWNQGGLMGTLLLIVLVLLIVGALPRWGHSRNWGYYPSGGLGTLAIILLILVLMGYIPHRF